MSERPAGNSATRHAVLQARNPHCGPEPAAAVHHDRPVHTPHKGEHQELPKPQDRAEGGINVQVFSGKLRRVWRQLRLFEREKALRARPSLVQEKYGGHWKPQEYPSSSDQQRFVRACQHPVPVLLGPDPNHGHAPLQRRHGLLPCPSEDLAAQNDRQTDHKVDGHKREHHGGGRRVHADVPRCHRAGDGQSGVAVGVAAQPRRPLEDIPERQHHRAVQRGEGVLHRGHHRARHQDPGGTVLRPALSLLRRPRQQDVRGDGR